MQGSMKPEADPYNLIGTSDAMACMPQVVNSTRNGDMVDVMSSSTCHAWLCLCRCRHKLDIVASVS
jgi:hypothetical protein